MSARTITRHIRSRLSWGRVERFSMTSVSAAVGCLFLATRSGACYYQRTED